MGQMGGSDRGARGLAACAKFAFVAALAGCAAGLMPDLASGQGGEPVEQAETRVAGDFFGETLDGPAPAEPAILVQNGVSLFVAGHRTAARRHSDYYLANGKPRRRSLAASTRLRIADDRNFTNRTRWLARRVAEIGRPAGAAQRGVATTGEEFLDALVAASRTAPIANLVVYGHAAPNALFMREDRGFYGAVSEVAKASPIVSGEEIEKDEQLRLAGARDLSDFEQLVARGEIKFARNAVILFAGCGVAGKRDIEPASIAARMAEITGAKVIASVDVTDQSMTRGRNFRDQEYSRRTWVRFLPAQPPERMNTKVIDALKELNFEGATVAAGPGGERLVER
jgi:hypothetical protein